MSENEEIDKLLESSRNAYLYEKDAKLTKKLRIIVYHSLNDAVRNLMCFANHDLTAGKDTWVAEWSNLVQDKITSTTHGLKTREFGVTQAHS